MRAFPPLAAALALALALAGCSGKGDGDRPDPIDDDLKADDETGLLRGITYTQALVPVPGVKVTLVGPGGNTTDLVSGPDGEFGVDGLEPGPYALTATKLGFFAARATALVEAGEDQPEVLRLTMLEDAATAPSAQPYRFEGLMECAVTVFALCGFVNDETSGAGLGNATEDNVQVHYNLTRAPTWVQSEMVWDSTQAAGDRMWLGYSWDCGDTFLCDHYVEGGSPLLLTADAATIAEIGIGNTTDLYIRVFAGGSEESGGLVGATVEQKFDIYTTVFYGYRPPEGWLFSETNEIPSPQ